MLVLLYECDSWLSNDSMVLDGIFTNEDSLCVCLRELIRSHRDEHVRGDDLYDYIVDLDDDEFGSDDEKINYAFDDFVEETIKVLLTDGQTQGLSVNYLLEYVEADRLL